MTAIPETNLFPYRPLVFYYITSHNPEELTYEAFYQDLADMKEKGYGGVIPFNRPPEGFSREMYFTEAWFDMIGNCLRAARDLQLRVWMNDDFDAPPGDIGGRLQKIAPHLKPLHLVLNGDTVEVKEATWGFPAFEDPESAQLFQKYVYEEYKRRFGEYFGSTIVGIFSDADSRRVNSDVYTPGSPMKDYFPWSTNFSRTFREKYGYGIEPYLPAILRRETLDQARDYWEHSGNLYMGWFESNYQWCKKNGLQYTFHTSDSAPMRIQTSYFNSAFAEGRAIDAGTHCDWPGTDHECLDLNGGRLFLRDRFHMSACIFGGDDSMRRAENFYDVFADLRAKQAQSCAYTYDKKGVMCEMYAAANWDASYKDLRNIASWQMMQGVNFIVYQAYHYKLRGETKFFAPLSFGRHSHTDFDMKAFNDAITENAYLCSQGRLKADFALLDPTDEIWRGSGDSWVYMELAKTLNRFPQGYVLADMKAVRRKAHELRAVVNPGLNLSDEIREEIKLLGLELWEAEEITTPAEAEKRLPTGIVWQGEGNLMFMRRRLDGGGEVVVAANIESDDTLAGTLTIAGQDYEIELTSGEMAFFGGECTRYRSPAKDEKKVFLSECAPVSFEKRNVIPLFRWEDEDGRGFSLMAQSRRKSFIYSAGWIDPPFEAINAQGSDHPLFPFTAEADMAGLELLISKKFSEKHLSSVSLDGKALIPTEETFVLDDPYFIYRFDADKGAHVLSLALTSPVDTQDALYLMGDFDVHMTASGETLYYCSVYSIQQYLPEKMTFALAPRSTSLRTGLSWAEQGQPFYSGTADYRFEVTLDEDMQEAALVLPGCRDAAKVWVDGEYAGVSVLPPYRIPLSLAKGGHTLTVRVGNTLGNMLEGYKAPSGLTGRPCLTKQ